MFGRAKLRLGRVLTVTQAKAELGPPGETREQNPEVIAVVNIEKCRRQLGPGVEFFCESFQAEAGERVALWGPSGCGKSTLLNLVSGLLKPDDGIVEVAGKEVHKMSQGGLDRYRSEHIGFVFQTFNLLSPFTALQNVLLGMRFSETLPSREWKDRATELLDRVGLSHRLHSKPRTMSVGEQQRVAIARALANKQEVVVADEPTGSLDPRTSDEVMDLLIEMCTEENVTLLLVTHEEDVAKRLERRFECRGLVMDTTR